MNELLKYTCRAPGCGKKFSTQKRLEIHISSKHPQLYSLLSSPDSTDLNFNKNPIENLLFSSKTKSNMLQPIKKKPIFSNIDNSIEKLNIKFNINCLKNDIPFENKEYINTNSENVMINEINDDLIFNGENNVYEDYTEIINLDLSKKNINNFENNKNIPFEYFIRIEKINLSYNNISKRIDLKFFTNLKILIINNNKINDISFCENLQNLEHFNINSNEITSIENLRKCNKLKFLDISNNKIENIINTLKTFKKLKNLEELNIINNPFIINLFAYKHYFIYNFQSLLKIDEEEINEIDKDISGRFIRENISMYENVKELNNSKFDNNEDTDSENDKDNNKDNNNIIYKIGNTIISKEMHIPYKSKNKNNNNIHKEKEKENKNNNKENNNIQEIQKENMRLKEVIEEQKKEIDNLKLELENSNLIIKDYESIISQYKLKYGEINSDNYETYNNIIIENEKRDKDKKEIENLKKDLELWKKEYFELLYKKMNKEKDNNNIEIFNEEILKINKDNNNEIIDNDLKKIERPKTAVNRYDNPLKEFEQLYKEISIMKSRNVFADVLEEDSEEEEENDVDIKNKSDNNIKKKIKNENDEKYKSNKILRPLLIKTKNANYFNTNK